MAKKAVGKKNHPAEILDDNGTLIASSTRAPGATAGGAEGEALPEADEREIPEP